MTDAEVAGPALRDWLNKAVAAGRVPSMAVGRGQIIELAQHARTLTPADVASVAPELAQDADEVVQVLRTAVSGADGDHGHSAGQPASGHESTTDARTPSPTPSSTPTDLDGLDFAAYRGGVPGQAPEALTVTMSADGQIAYAWPSRSHPGGVTVYRVVVGDHARPLGPDDGQVMATTTDPSAVDRDPGESALRHVQVWLHAGADLTAAAAAQPVLWAETTMVSPVRGPQAAWDHGAIVARWRVVPGVERVRVFRLPAQSAGRVLAHELDQYAVRPQEQHLYGIVDDGGTPGQQYVYRVVAEAHGSWSPSVDIPVELPHEAQGVDDLVAHIERQPTGHRPGSVTLEWSQAVAGEVVVYRSASGPPPGLINKFVTQAVLTENGLTHPVPNPVEPTGEAGRFQMRSVQWPPGWTSAYFIPLTVVGEQFLAGKPAKVTGVPVPRDPELQHRGYVQVVSFGWPEQVGTVRVHLAPQGSDPEEVVGGRAHAEVDRQRYVRDGGVRLALPPDQGVDVVLTAWVTGETRSAPVVVPVASRLVVRYSVEPRKRLLLGGIAYGRVVVWTEQSLQGVPPFVVVCNQDRLPLHAGDGNTLQIVPDDAPDSSPQPVLRPATLSGGPQGAAFRALMPKDVKAGYVRLFVAAQIPAEVRQRMLIMDPPVASLIWK